MFDPQRLYWTTGRPPQLLTMAVTHVQTCAVSYHFQSSFVNLLDRSTAPYRAPRARKGSALPASPIPRPTHLLCTCGVCVTHLEQRPCCCARPSGALIDTRHRLLRMCQLALASEHIEHAPSPTATLLRRGRCACSRDTAEHAREGRDARGRDRNNPEMTVEKKTPRRFHTKKGTINHHSREYGIYGSLPVGRRGLFLSPRHHAWCAGQTPDPSRRRLIIVT